MEDTEQSPAPWGYVSCRFGDSGPGYSYKAPFPVAVGDKVWVQTKRGKSAVTIVDLDGDPERATASILEPYVKPGEAEDDTNG